MKTLRLGATLILGSLVLIGCSARQVYTTDEEQDSAPAQPVDVSHVRNAVPKVEPRSRYGNPDSYVVFGKTYYTLDSSLNFTERGIASWYGTKFHGRRTSSGEPYDMLAMTAAHKSLPLPTYVEVSNIENGRKIIVKVNDRGPFHQNRIIDLSYAAAIKLGIDKKGTGLVEIRAINPSKLETPPTQTVIKSDNSAVQQAAASVQPAIKPAQPGMQISTTKMNPHPDIFIQTGAFSNQSNALRLQKKLQQALGKTVRISEISNNGQTLYRVQVGPVEGVEQADLIAEQLQNMGMPNQQTIIE